MDRNKIAKEDFAERARPFVEQLLRRRSSEKSPQFERVVIEIVEALYAAGREYECSYGYWKENHRKLGPKRRRDMFEQLLKDAVNLQQGFRSLDPFIKRSVDQKLRPTWLPMMLGLLDQFVSGDQESLTSAGRQILEQELKQRRGKSPNFPQQEWVFAVAEIYQNWFGEEPRVSGTGSTRSSSGPFYELLSACWPRTLGRAGTLSPLQVKRYLEKRKEMMSHRHVPVVSLF